MAEKRIVNPDGTVEKRRIPPESTQKAGTGGYSRRVSPNYVPPSGRPAPYDGRRSPQAPGTPPTYGEWQKKQARRQYGTPQKPGKSGTISGGSRSEPYVNRRPVGETHQDNQRRVHNPAPPYDRGSYRQGSAPGYNRAGTGKTTAEAAREIQKKLNKKSTDSRQSGTKHSPRPAPQNKASNWTIPETPRMYSGTAPQNRQPPKKEYNPPKANTRKASMNEAAKREKEARKSERRAKRHFFVKAFFIRLGLSFVACLLLFGILYLLIFTSASEGGKKTEYVFHFGEGYSFTADSSLAYRKGVMYTDFSSFSEILGLTYVGSVDSVRFIIPDKDAEDSAGSGKEEYVIFTDGSGSATVNGSGVTMEGECFTSGTHVWIPFSFIEQYVRGITSEKDGGTVSIRSENEKEKDGVILIPEINFSMKKTLPLEHAEYPSEEK